MVKTKTIIVVDDDPVSNFLCTRIVAKSEINAEVKAFLHGREALDFIEQCINSNADLPDLILLDVNMPLMNGWEFLDEYKILVPKMSKAIPVFILSSSVYNQDIQKARAIPEVSDYLIKPITVDLIKDLWSKQFTVS